MTAILSQQDIYKLLNQEPSLIEGWLDLDEQVQANGFLAAAGIKARDVILSINGVEFDRHGIVIGREGHYRHKNIFDVMRLAPIGDEVEITYIRNGEISTARANAKRNPEKGVVSHPIIEERKYLEVFGMIIQQLSFEIIEAMNEIDVNARIDMLQTIDQEKPMLAVTLEGLPKAKSPKLKTERPFTCPTDSPSVSMRSIFRSIISWIFSCMRLER